MSRKNLMLLVNPAAGKSSYMGALGAILEIFYRGGYTPAVFFTSKKRDAVEIAAENAYKYDLVVCFGGDGTLSETVSGLMESGKTPPPIGYIPAGTSNDVATTLGLQKDPRKAAKAILEGKPTPFDIGLFNGKSYFTYISAFGAFTDVSYKTPQTTKQYLGHLAYFFDGISRLSQIKHQTVTVEHDSGIFRDDLIFGSVTNSISVAGMFRLNENLVELDDGIFELILVKNPKNLLEINGILSEIRSQNYSGKSLTVIQTRRARFIFDEPVSWTLDGENGGEHKEVCFENRQASVSFIV